MPIASGAPARDEEVGHAPNVAPAADGEGAYDEDGNGDDEPVVPGPDASYSQAEDGAYDLVISNAVFNVIPGDWRAQTLHRMAAKVAQGGRLFINVRDAAEVAKIPNRVTLDSPSEVLVTQPDGRPRHYQRGFARQEFADWIRSELGDGWTVENATLKNIGVPRRASRRCDKE